MRASHDAPRPRWGLRPQTPLNLSGFFQQQIMRHKIFGDLHGI
jgi:hypothetical protein